eukprot:9809275-Prorocentrum_lima.AAC.1
MEMLSLWKGLLHINTAGLALQDQLAMDWVIWLEHIAVGILGSFALERKRMCLQYSWEVRR